VGQNKRINLSNPPGPLVFFVLAVVVGLVAGLGAVLFRGLIAFFHNLLLLGQVSVTYDANVHTPPSPWGPLVILVPVVGAASVAFLVKNFAPEAKGHGVPEVMDAIYYNKGVIRPVVAAVKSLASALSIGSGGAIGREGPIIQIGSSFGSTLGQYLPLATWQRITLIGAGAGAGIAATFNTPIGGILFAIEIMMVEVSARTLVPVAMATVTATYLGRVFFGPHPAFVIPALETHYFHLGNPWLLLSYVGLGVITGLVSVIYIKSIYAFEDFFDERVPGNYYTRHMAGMFLVGMMMYLLLINRGHYYIEGVGYATIQDVLSGMHSSLPLLLLLFFLKLLATSLTLGSGASGGIFSPALFMGATLGGAYGLVLNQLFPGMAVSTPAFAVAGMAGMIGGATGAVMTAIVMIFEMTLDYTVIIPIAITVAVGYGIRQWLSRESIYTMKLVRRGHTMPEALHTNFHYLKRAREVMETRFGTIPAATTPEKFVQLASTQPDVLYFLVEDGARIIGLMTRDMVSGVLAPPGKSTTLGEIANHDYVAMPEDATLLDITARLRAQQKSIALIVRTHEPASADNVVGVITKEQLGESLIQATELFSD
jgi:CIC family chloride channel protein